MVDRKRSNRLHTAFQLRGCAPGLRVYVGERVRVQPHVFLLKPQQAWLEHRRSALSTPWGGVGLGEMGGTFFRVLESDLRGWEPPAEVGKQETNVRFAEPLNWQAKLQAHRKLAHMMLPTPHGCARRGLGQLLSIT